MNSTRALLKFRSMRPARIMLPCAHNILKAGLRTETIWSADVPTSSCFSSTKKDSEFSCYGVSLIYRFFEAMWQILLVTGERSYLMTDV